MQDAILAVFLEGFWRPTSADAWRSSGIDNAGIPSTRADLEPPDWQDLAEQRLQMVQLLLRASAHPMHWPWAFSSPASMGKQHLRARGEL